MAQSLTVCVPLFLASADMLLPHGYSLVAPVPEADLEELLLLRWKVLREPWNQLRGTERDEQEESTYHVLIRNSAGLAVASGRLQEPSPQVFQIRYMAVDERERGLGLGRCVVEALEAEARRQGGKEVFLQARENAVAFYEACGYVVTEPTFLLWDLIQHYRMEKAL